MGTSASAVAMTKIASGTSFFSPTCLTTLPTSTPCTVDSTTPIQANM